MAEDRGCPGGPLGGEPDRGHAVRAAADALRRAHPPLTDPDDIARVVLEAACRADAQVGVHRVELVDPGPATPDQFTRWLAGGAQRRQQMAAVVHNPGGRMSTIEIRGVWLTKSPAHLGNDIEVLVEMPDGTYRAAITGSVCDDGPISHYVHPRGIETAPVREFDPQ